MTKLDDAYKSIGEVAKILNLVNKKNGNLNTHTIRFWEKEIKQIKPKILTGNRRYYDKNTIDLLKKVKFLLKDHGMTINGVKKLLSENKSIKLDEMSNESISTNNLKLKNKIKKILNIVKEIKKLK
jgi:Predicted transcriptional regulators|tara:strand:- start:70 stop:447 length:378 start_codon:yes stop_codon:yes gene_type:complete